MENALPVAPLRTGGPLYVAGELQSDRPDLLEGRLRFRLLNGPETLAVVETDPIVLVPGGRMRFRQFLPVPEGLLGYGPTGISASFLTEEGTLPLGEIIVPSLRGNVWQAVVLAVEPTPGAGLGSGERLHQEMVFEKAMPDPTGNVADGDEFGIITSRPTLAASDLPEQALSYCAFDAVQLSGEAFPRLTARKLEAIGAWVRAGGALCVAVDRPLEQKQITFLEDLFRDSDAGPFLRDEDGRLLEPAGTSQGVFARRAGLGFAVVLLGAPDQLNFDTPAWREAHARLWRLREKYVALRREGTPITAAMFESSESQPSQPVRSFRPGQAAVSGQVRGVAYSRPNAQLHPRGWSFPASQLGTVIVTRMRPESIRLMPGWAVVAILFGYVAIVGPLDYFVLGWLRLRKWTWLTFPAATLAVTGGVVATANVFLSDNNHVRAVDVIDLDARGEPVRRTRLDLHFRGSSEPVVHELEKAYFTRLDPTHFASPAPANPVVVNGRLVYEKKKVTNNDAPTGPYTGTIASRYVVPQQIAKWTPQVNRTFEIAPKMNVPKIDWAKLEDPSRNLTMTTAFFGRQLAHVARYSGTGDRGFPMPDGSQSILGYAATAAALSDRWSLVFQRSPLGQGRLDDLPFFDAMTDSLGAVVVWTKDAEGNIIIYRKPVRKDL